MSYFGIRSSTIGSTTMYCPNPDCDGKNGVEMRYVKDTWEELGFAIDEECPYCDESFPLEQPIDWKYAVVSVLDELPRVLEERVDQEALIRAVYEELRKQNVI